ncbi:unnamed protein product [Moneuplotes crassus]|uniref:Uncharacterized protein n=1 Tax=Euplotes crassus TaxID=5936 RepID=A0AAD1XXW9_EUPCR|nr:unnamed protein product [Moneuplotes crassus]
MFKCQIFKDIQRYEQKFKAMERSIKYLEEEIKYNNQQEDESSDEQEENKEESKELRNFDDLNESRGRLMEFKCLNEGGKLLDPKLESKATSQPADLERRHKNAFLFKTLQKDLNLQRDTPATFSPSKDVDKSRFTTMLKKIKKRCRDCKIRELSGLPEHHLLP